MIQNKDQLILILQTHTTTISLEGFELTLTPALATMALGSSSNESANFPIAYCDKPATLSPKVLIYYGARLK